MRVAVFGASGFVGGATVRAIKHLGHQVTELSAPRFSCDGRTATEINAAAARLADSQEHRPLGRTLEGHHAVINCAGLASPDARPTPELTGANALLPSFLYALTRRALGDVFVHVSSAAVQGRQPVLDERFNYDVRSPYAASKALGELALRDATAQPTDVRIYRATSVQAPDRSITKILLKLAHAPVVPLSGSGDHPLPLALIDNTAAAVAHAATTPSLPQLVVHPWEAMTTERFFRLVNPSVRFVRLPRIALEAAGEALWALAPHSGLLAAVAKRADLMVNGQRSAAGSLAETGFVPPAGDAGYAALGRNWRHDREVHR